VIFLTENSNKKEFPALRPVGLSFFGTVQPCIKPVVFVIARSILCDEALPRRSSWPDKWEIASPKNGSQ
jgi:hypothetical protein